MPKGHATASRICYRKELSRNIQIHQKRLAEISRRKKGTGTLDNKAPKTSKMGHLKRNRKQEQVEEERFRASSPAAIEEKESALTHPPPPTHTLYLPLRQQ